MFFKVLFRLTQTLDNALFICGTVRNQRYDYTKKAKYGQGNDQRPIDKAKAHKPKLSTYCADNYQRTANAKNNNSESCKERIIKPLEAEHLPKLFSRHTYALEHGEFAAAGNNACKDSVDEVQHADDSDNQAQGSADI